MLVAPSSGNPYSYFIFAMCVLVFHFISAKLSNEQVWYSQVVVGFFFFISLKSTYCCMPSNDHCNIEVLVCLCINSPMSFRFDTFVHSLSSLPSRPSERTPFSPAINFTFELLLKSPMKMLISIVYWKITTFGIN